MAAAIPSVDSSEPVRDSCSRRLAIRAWVRLAAVLELRPGALDAQMRRGATSMDSEYFVLAMLSEAP